MVSDPCSEVGGWSGPGGGGGRCLALACSPQEVGKETHTHTGRREPMESEFPEKGRVVGRWHLAGSGDEERAMAGGDQGLHRLR